MRYCKITIVTCSYNQGQFLEATIQSVLGQNYPNLEYIIIDGGSTDNSVGIIKRYEKHLTYWQSKPDKGQSDGLRQGFARATGEIMNWVNSDDLLAPQALGHLARLHAENPGAEIYAGSIGRFHETPEDLFEKYDSKGWCPEGFLRRSPSGSFAFNQPGAFFARSLYERVGGVDPNLHMCMDYEMFLKMCELKPKIIYTDRIIAFFRHHSGSKTTCGTDKALIREHAELLKIFLESSRRTGIPADISHSSNLLHWLLFRRFWHGDFGVANQAWRALRQTEGQPSLKIVGQISNLLVKRLVGGKIP